MANRVEKLCSKFNANLAAGLFVIASLALLNGCQGISKAITQQNSPGTLGASPNSLSFGNVTVGKNQSLSGTVTNSGDSSVTVSQISINGTGFTLSGITVPLTLAAGQSAPFSVMFSPAALGSATGTVTVSSNASNSTMSVSLTGMGATAAGQLSVSPSTIAVGSVVDGTSGTASGNLTASGASVTVTAASISNSAFSISGLTLPVTIPEGQSVPFTITFHPSSIGSASATLTVTSNGQPSTSTGTLTGTGTAAVGQLSISPSTLAIGNVVNGATGTGSGSLSASGASVTVTAASTNNSAFTLSGLSLPVTIPAGQSVPFTITFHPTSVGSASATLTVTSNAQPTTSTETLTGTGTAVSGQLSVSPSTLAVGNVVDGSSGTASGSLNASGSSVTITAASTNNSVFAISGLSLPVTIPAGQSVPFTITFSPTAVGSVSATLTVTSDAQPSTSTETLTGTGTAASTHSVSLSWNASASPNILGYNIYRAVYTTSCGSYTKVNSVLNTSTLYTDSTVANGSSYCYAATAVDTSNEESGYSNIVNNVQIPTT
jgi:hypothetical protein